MKRIFFFATANDIIPVLNDFEASNPLKYVDLGNLTTPNRSIYLTSLDIPNIGLASNETASSCTAYMVSERDEKNHARKFVGTDGYQRWTLDNADNENSIILTLGGLWDDNVLLPGSADTLHNTLPSQLLMKSFLSCIKDRKFKKVEHWWVGEESMQMLQNGRRLSTTAAQSPSDFDLSLPK